MIKIIILVEVKKNTYKGMMAVWGIELDNSEGSSLSNMVNSVVIFNNKVVFEG